MSLSKYGFTTSAKRKNPDPPSVSSKKPKTTSSGKQASHFRNEWLTGRKQWLYYKDDECGMYCRLCQKHKMRPYDRETWNSVPCKRLRLGSITQHENAVAHQMAMKMELLAESSKNIAEAIQPEICGNAITSAFRCLYFLAKRRVPHTTNFEPLLDLLTQLGLSVKADLNIAKNVTYCSDGSIQEMLSIISTQLEELTLKQLKNSPYFAIMLDETTDVSVCEQLTLNCRYLDSNGKICVQFLKLIEPLKATTTLNAENISGHVTSYFRLNELNFDNLCGIGTDGAAVMTGKRNGVVKRLQDIAKSAIGVHCCGHRLQLASSQAANDIPYVKKFGTILRQLYDFFDNSAVRIAGLHAVQSALHEKTLKPLAPSSTRWLSIDNSVTRLRESFVSVLVSLEREGEERGDAKAVGLFHMCRNYRFVATMLFLCNVLPTVSRLCKAFQSKTFEYSSIQPLVQATVTTLNGMKDATEHLSQLPDLLERLKSADIQINKRADDDDFFKEHVCRKYIDKLVENISRRFQANDIDLLSNFNVFEPNNLIAADEAFGNDQIMALSSHFLKNDGCDIKHEWTTFKAFATGSLLKQPDLKTDVLVDYLCTANLAKDAFPNITRLAQIYRIIPCHTADSERTFSQLKLIKTASRNRLNQRSLDGLVRIAIDGPSGEEFDFAATVQSWAHKKNRRIRTS